VRYTLARLGFRIGFGIKARFPCLIESEFKNRFGFGFGHGRSWRYGGWQISDRIAARRMPPRFILNPAVEFAGSRESLAFSVA
jgi:hypothetical protein